MSKLATGGTAFSTAPPGAVRHLEVMPFVTILLIAAALLVSAMTARAETLVEALVLAYVNNPALLAARADLRAVDEQVPQALSGWRPTVTLNGNFDRRRVRNNFSARSTAATGSTGGGGGGFTSEDRNSRSYSLNIEQPLFQGGRTLAETRRAEDLIQAQRAALLDIEQKVLGDVVAAYMNVVRDQALLELNVNNEQVLRRQAQATHDRFEVGDLTLTDVSQADSRLARATADRIEAEGALMTSRAAYRNLTGAVPGRFEAPPPLAGLPESEDEARSIADAENPAIMAARFEERAADEAIAAVRGELLPTVSLTGELSRSQDQFSTIDQQDEASFGARVTVPLYQSGSVFSRLREAHETAGQRRIQIEETRRNVGEETTRARAALKTARARIVSFEAEVQATMIALDGVRQEELVGARTVLDVLDAEQEHLDAKVNLVRARRDKVVAAYEMLASLGRLTARQLDLPVNPYNFEVHYNEVKGRWF
jgi:outer membrane protein/adhesin transport system outer membrane protein